jgi:flagellar protein FliO/FliZ
MNFFEVLAFIIIFGSILFLAYVASKFVASKSNNLMKSRHIQVIESVSLGIDKRLMLVKVGEQYYLLSSTSKQIELIDKVEINPETVNISADLRNYEKSINFAAILGKYANSVKNLNFKRIREGIEKSPVYNAGGQRFKQNLEKLRSITQKKSVNS